MSVARWVAAVWLVSAAFWSGCATVPRAPSSPSEEAISAGMQRYARLVEAMDHAGIAALFTPDGEIGIPGRPPIAGRDAILRHLESSRDVRVLSEQVTTETYDIHGANGHVTGHYRQRARLPSGRAVEARGSYAADWHREADGNWYIRFMTTRPER